MKFRFLIFFIILTVVLQLILAFQGFDVCDDGFVLTFYQQFFNAPESVEYNFLYWFSGLVGGIWYKINENGGVYWFRVLGVITNTFTFIFVYKILKKYVPKVPLLLAISMALFVNDYGFLSFYHNHLTALLLLVITYTILLAIQTEKRVFFFLVGILLAINSFTRLPNILFFCVVFIIPLATYIKQKPKKDNLIPLLAVFMGTLTGLAVVVLLLTLLNHRDIFIQAIRVVNDLGNTEGSSHNFNELISVQFHNYKGILKSIIVLISMVVFNVFLYKFTKKYSSFFLFLILSLLFVCFVFWIYKFHIYAIYSISATGSLYILISKRFDLNLRLIGFISLIILFVIPLGSAGGILNIGYNCVWLGIPLVYLTFFDITSKAKLLFLNSDLMQFRRYTLIIFAIAFFSYKSYSMFNEAYFDPGSRWLKTEKIKSKFADNIFTTPIRASIINTLLEELSQYVKKEDYLLVYDSFPMLHFLTETKPYCKSSWPYIYDYNTFDKKLKEAEKKIKIKPIIVQQKFSTIFKFSNPIDNYLTTKNNDNNPYQNVDLNRVFNDFLGRNNYKIIWSNEYFNIYQSTEQLK